MCIKPEITSNTVQVKLRQQILLQARLLSCDKSHDSKFFKFFVLHSALHDLSNIEPGSFSGSS